MNVNRTSLCLIATLALGAAFYPAHAGDEGTLPGATPAAAESSFDSAFTPFTDMPAIPEEVLHAVDVTAIEPPADGTARSLGSGMASYYGKRFAGRRTASGETFDPSQLTAAHRTLPFGSLVQVTNPVNGRSVVVRINDRGPFAKSRVIDVSRRAAEELGLIRSGHAMVELALVEE